jgi:glycosyltransferase involved in cell wall biosynthesis
MEKPFVSILIPTYNREKLIAESIHSALSQNYGDFEVVVVDNASTDGTWEQIQRIASADSRLRAFRNEANVGPVRNWIECARHARGTLCKILWSDDLIDAEYLNRTVPLLTDPQVSFVYTSARIFKESMASTSGSVHYDHLPTGVYDTRFFIEGSLLDNRFPVSPGCFLLRTEDLRKNLMADVPNAVGSDFKSHAIGNDLLLLLLTANDYEKFGTVNEPLSMFRDHAGSISTSSGMQRLIIHYDMAKAYFVQRASMDKRLRRRFNTLLWLHRQRYDGESFGIRRLQDFYPALTDTRISITYLLQRTLRRLLRVN